MTIAICDNQEKSRFCIRKLLLSYAKKHMLSYIIKDYDRSKHLIEEKEQIDLVFLNYNLSDHPTWQLPNFNVSGAKLFVLFSFSNRTYFHAHIRLLKDDTDFMRYGNRLSWQISPIMQYDAKYEQGGSTFLQGDIYTR